MCLLTLAPEGIEHDRADLEEACYSNPDGFGYAIHAGRHIIRRRSMDARTLLDRYMVERREHIGGAAIFHARIATSGVIDNSTCHPFLLPGNAKVAIAHNGVLPIKQPTGWRSDTRHLVDVVLPSHGGIHALRDADYLSDLEKWMGNPNKIAILSADRRLPAWQILNEQQGHWSTGIWWSNHSYYKWTPTPTSKAKVYEVGPGGKLQEVCDDEYLDDIPEDWPCPTCDLPVGETALEDGRCQHCWADLDQHVNSAWCTCERCLKDVDEEFEAWLRAEKRAEKEGA